MNPQQKNAFKKRLEANGLWKRFLKDREDVKPDVLKRGFNAGYAWDMLAEKYLALLDAAENPGGLLLTTIEEVADGVNVVPSEDQGPAISAAPKTPKTEYQLNAGPPLATSTPDLFSDLADRGSIEYAKEVEWAYHNFAAYRYAVEIQKDPHKANAILASAPSPGASATLLFGFQSPSKFLGDIVPKMLGRDEVQAENKAMRDDRRKIMAVVEDLEAWRVQRGAA